MLFQKVITVPLNTLEATKYHEQMRIAVGMLDKIWIKFPAGCHNMIFLQILHGRDTLAPSEHNQSLVGDDQEFISSHNTEIKTGYETLDVYAWSPGTTYAHNVTVTVNVFTATEYSRLETLMEQVAKRIETLGAFLGVESG